MTVTNYRNYFYMEHVYNNMFITQSLQHVSHQPIATICTHFLLFLCTKGPFPHTTLFTLFFRE